MKKFFKGFVYATRGICVAANERNMRVHLVVSWFVIFFGVYFHLSRIEWIVLFFAMGIVLAAEAMNTAFEYVVNLIRDDCHVPYRNVHLGKAKDIAAGAVLILAVISAVIGVLIFYPHVARLF